MNVAVRVRRVCYIVAGAAALMVLWSIAYVRTHSSHPSLREYSKVLAAAADYGRRLQAEGVAVPASVTLKDLITRGVVQPGDAKGFEGLAVTVSLQPTETRPQDVIMSVTFPDGREVVALGDGSVQERVGK